MAGNMPTSGHLNPRLGSILGIPGSVTVSLCTRHRLSVPIRAGPRIRTRKRSLSISTLSLSALQPQHQHKEKLFFLHLGCLRSLHENKQEEPYKNNKNHDSSSLFNYTLLLLQQSYSPFFTECINITIAPHFRPIFIKNQ